MKTMRVPSSDLPNLSEKETTNIQIYQKLRYELQSACDNSMLQSDKGGIIGGITLSPGNFCSGGCAYCYAKKRLGRNRIQTPLEVLRAVFEFIRTNKYIRRGCGITLGGGGDPLENFDVYLTAIDMSKRYMADYGIHIPIYLATVEPWFLKEEMIETILQNQRWITLSIDGDMNDSVYHRRRSSYVPLVNKYRSEVIWAASGVFTAKTVKRLKHNYEHLISQGFESVQLRPARLPTDNPLSLQEQHFKIAVEQYEDLITTQISKGTLVDFIRRLSTADTIGHLFYRYITGLDIQYRCSATNRESAGAIFVSASGDIYPCPSTRFSSFYIGNLTKGDINIARLTNQNMVPAECSSCLIRNVCGGPCMYESMLSSNTARSITPQNCKFMLDTATLVQSVICQMYESDSEWLVEILNCFAYREFNLIESE